MNEKPRESLAEKRHMCIISNGTFIESRNIMIKLLWTFHEKICQCTCGEGWGWGGIFNGIAQGQGVNTTSSAQFVILRCFD